MHCKLKNLALNIDIVLRVWMCNLLMYVPLQDDGGSPISHYMVEQKDKSGQWKPISKFCRQPKCDVSDLEEGEKYEFRVSAVNEQGQSEPLVTTRPIVAKHPFGKSAFGVMIYFLESLITISRPSSKCVSVT